MKLLLIFLMLATVIGCNDNKSVVPQHGNKNDHYKNGGPHMDFEIPPSSPKSIDPEMMLTVYNYPLTVEKTIKSLLGKNGLMDKYDDVIGYADCMSCDVISQKADSIAKQMSDRWKSSKIDLNFAEIDGMDLSDHFRLMQTTSEKGTSIIYIIDK